MLKQEVAQCRIYLASIAADMAHLGDCYLIAGTQEFPLGSESRQSPDVGLAYLLLE